MKGFSLRQEGHSLENEQHLSLDVGPQGIFVQFDVLLCGTFVIRDKNIRNVVIAVVWNAENKIPGLINAKQVTYP